MQINSNLREDKSSVSFQPLDVTVDTSETVWVSLFTSCTRSERRDAMDAEHPTPIVEVEGSTSISLLVQ